MSMVRKLMHAVQFEGYGGGAAGLKHIDIPIPSPNKDEVLLEMEAKLGNTHMTITCGARNIDLVKSLGADEVLDYKTPEGAVLKSPSGQKYDVVIHCAIGISWSTFEPNLSSNGKVIDITPGPSALRTFALKKLTFSKKQLVPLLLSPQGENLAYLLNLVKERKLRTVIDSEYSLTSAKDA